MVANMTDIGLSIGFVVAITFILGYYANGFLADRHHPTISYQEMIIVACIGALLLLAFPALFLLVGRFI